MPYLVATIFGFPYFFVGTFIEGSDWDSGPRCWRWRFPYFFVGTFIEGPILRALA